MKISTDYQKEIISLSRELPSAELKKVLDFALFLKTKKEGFSYKQVDDSVAYVRSLRAREGKRLKSAEQFIQELKEWQSSNSCGNKVSPRVRTQLNGQLIRASENNHNSLVILEF